MKRPGSTSALPVLVSDAYTSWRQSEVGRITDEIELGLMLELLGDVRDRRVLDIGCGDGALAVCLARRGADVTGIDASPAMIAAARQRALDAGVPVNFCVGRAEELPFGASSFDLAAAVTVLCFIPDATRTFTEASRVIHHGGRLVIGELGRYSTWAMQRRLRAWLGNELWRRARFRSSGELRRVALAAGFDPIAVRGAVYYPRSGIAARAMRKVDRALGRLTTVGAAFVALAATRQ